MNFYLGIIGLGMNLVGGFLVFLGDAWFSRSVLVYLDALEATLTKAIEVLQRGGQDAVDSRADLLRDRGQNQARSLKSLGWIFLMVGFLSHLMGLVMGPR